MMKGGSVYKIFIAISVSLIVSGCAASDRATNGDETNRAQVSDEDRQRATQHFVEGSLYEMQGEYERAIEEFQKALRYDESAAIYYALSKSYTETGKLAMAAEAGREAVRRDSTNISYRENLANVYIRAREIERAIGQYEVIIRLDERNVQAHYNLARLLQFDKPLRALEVYNTMVARFGEQLEVLAQIVDLNNSLGRHEEAIDALERMIAIDPGNETVMLTLGTTYMHAGDNEKAKEIFLDLFESHPDDLEVLTSLVDVYVRLDDFEAAGSYLLDVIRDENVPFPAKLHIGQVFVQHIEQREERDPETMKLAGPIFDAIIEQHPDEPEPRFYRGIVAIFTGDNALAAEQLVRVTELDPSNEAAWLYAGEAYFQNGQYEESIAVLGRGLEHHPADYELSFLLGLSYNRIENLEKAVDYLGRAVELKPEEVTALSMLALTYDSKEEHEISDSLYEHALTIDPDNHLVLNNFSYSLAERDKQLERALEMSERAVEMNPDNTAYLDTLGWIYFKLGDLDRAKEYIRKAIDGGSDSAVVHDHMGDIYYHLNDPDRAMEYWRQSFELDDSNEEVKRKIEHGTI
jgi:tetratricopeptide (TPR) repeat protein